MVNALRDKKTPMVTIVETKGENRTDSNDNRASFKGEPQGSTISYNADNKTGPAPDVNGSHDRPPAVGLGHEISHGNAIGKGADKAENGDKAGALNRSEKNAIKDEQKIRSEHNLPARKESSN